MKTPTEDTHGPSKELVDAIVRNTDALDLAMKLSNSLKKREIALHKIRSMFVQWYDGKSGLDAGDVLREIDCIVTGVWESERKL